MKKYGIAIVTLLCTMALQRVEGMSCIEVQQLVISCESSSHTTPIKIAENIVAQLGAKIDQALFTTDLKSLAHFKNQLATLGGDYQKASSLLDDPSSFEFVIRRTESRREDILKSGFLNYHATGKSRRGTNLGDRSLAESQLLRMRTNEYESQDLKNLGAKYGVLTRAPGEATESEANIASGYGRDKWILKKNAVESRTTFTMQDSLGVGRMLSRVDDKSHWSASAIPWSHRHLMAPFFASLLKDGKGLQNLPLFSELKLPPDLKGYSLSEFQRGGRWVEMQYLGPLILDDVEIFEFTLTPPTPEFAAELRKKGIQIRDGRTQPPKIY